jgi:hypothetical protein
MSCRLVYGVFGLAVVMLVTTAFAQGVITEIKTPPMRDSDVMTIPMALHYDDGTGEGNPYMPAIPGSGWAGAVVTMHILDAREVDIDAITPVPGTVIRYRPVVGGPPVTIGPTQPWPDPFGPRSANAQSVPLVFTVIHSQASGSGIDVKNSINIPLFDLDIHAKNTFLENSDWDVTFKFSDIWHLRPGPGSLQIHARDSMMMWVWSDYELEAYHLPDSTYGLPTDPPPIDYPNAHWFHLPESLIFHTVEGQGSAFFRSFLNTAWLGVEHVPEPTTSVLCAVGVACALMGLWSRGRRRSQV